MLRIETPLMRTVLIIQSWKGFNLLLMLYRSFPISKVGMDGYHPAGTARRHSASRLEQAVLAGLKPLSHLQL
jgi:hypothetical protein